ncbi:MAG: D-hexose-6-phosphate mutarotase [Pseudomonadota bacterium]
MPTSDFAALKHKFELGGQLELVQEPDGMVIVRINNAQAHATIALQGAHVMTFQPNVSEQPVLWLSPVAKPVPGKSIRGGIPVCWPWFGAHPTVSTFPAHGFARTAVWQVVATLALADGSTSITFELPQSSMPAAQWPYACRLQLVVTVGLKLTVELITENTGNQVFEIGEALHTYFNISDVDTMRITGLEGCTYLDKVGAPEVRTQQGPIQIGSEVDRIYVNSTQDCVIDDGGYMRSIRIAKSGSHSTVVWNPWIEKSAKMGDFGSSQGYRGMVCVESANAAENVVRVAPGVIHSIRAIYSIDEV